MNLKLPKLGTSVRVLWDDTGVLGGVWPDIRGATPTRIVSKGHLARVRKRYIVVATSRRKDTGLYGGLWVIPRGCIRKAKASK